MENVKQVLRYSSTVLEHAGPGSESCKGLKGVGKSGAGSCSLCLLQKKSICQFGIVGNDPIRVPKLGSTGKVFAEGLRSRFGNSLKNCY